jgi:hypothetical protein
MKILIALLFLSVCSFAQQASDLKAFDYSRADSIALHLPVKKFKTTEALALALTKDLVTEEEKFRAIFRWITNNVEYSYSNRKEDPKKAMNGKKAVCIGYSTLLKELCGTVGINCPVVTGHARNSIDDIGRKFSSNHAWNAAFLGGSWHLVDVTWASGFFDEEKRKFTRSFSDFFFLTPPDDFANTHFPDEKKWQLLDKNIRFRKFTRTPLKYSGTYAASGASVNTGGIIRASHRRPLRIGLSLEEPPEDVVLGIGNENYIRPRVSRAKDGSYTLELPPVEKGEFEMNVFVNGKAVSGHRLIVR